MIVFDCTFNYRKVKFLPKSNVGYLNKIGNPLNWQISNSNCKYQAGIIFQISFSYLRSGVICDKLRLSKPTRNMWYHTIQRQNWCFSRLVLSCHKYNLKPNLVQYIYPISYKIEKKANPRKKIYPIENCRYEIKAKMLAVSKVFRPIDILTVLLQITTATKPPIRE